MINMTIWIRNHTVNVCNAISAPAAMVTLWVRWKKPVKSVITLDHWRCRGFRKGLGNNTDNTTKICLYQDAVKNRRMHESGFYTK